MQSESGERMNGSVNAQNSIAEREESLESGEIRSSSSSSADDDEELSALRRLAIQSMEEHNHSPRPAALRRQRSFGPSRRRRCHRRRCRQSRDDRSRGVRQADGHDWERNSNILRKFRAERTAMWVNESVSSTSYSSEEEEEEKVKRSLIPIVQSVIVVDEVVSESSSDSLPPKSSSFDSSTRLPSSPSLGKTPLSVVQQTGEWIHEEKTNEPISSPNPHTLCKQTTQLIDLSSEGEFEIDDDDGGGGGERDISTARKRPQINYAQYTLSFHGYKKENKHAEASDEHSSQLKLFISNLEKNVRRANLRFHESEEIILEKRRAIEGKEKLVNQIELSAEKIRSQIATYEETLASKLSVLCTQKTLIGALEDELIEAQKTNLQIKSIYERELGELRTAREHLNEAHKRKIVFEENDVDEDWRLACRSERESLRFINQTAPINCIPIFREEYLHGKLFVLESIAEKRLLHEDTFQAFFDRTIFPADEIGFLTAVAWDWAVCDLHETDILPPTPPSSFTSSCSVRGGRVSSFDHYVPLCGDHMAGKCTNRDCRLQHLLVCSGANQPPQKGMLMKKAFENTPLPFLIAQHSRESHSAFEHIHALTNRYPITYKTIEQLERELILQPDNEELWCRVCLSHLNNSERNKHNVVVHVLCEAIEKCPRSTHLWTSLIKLTENNNDHKNELVGFALRCVTHESITELIFELMDDAKCKRAIHSYHSYILSKMKKRIDWKLLLALAICMGQQHHNLLHFIEENVDAFDDDDDNECWANMHLVRLYVIAFNQLPAFCYLLRTNDVVRKIQSGFMVVQWQTSANLQKLIQETEKILTFKAHPLILRNYILMIDERTKKSIKNLMQSSADPLVEAFRRAVHADFSNLNRLNMKCLYYLTSIISLLRRRTRQHYNSNTCSLLFHAIREEVQFRMGYSPQAKRLMEVSQYSIDYSFGKIIEALIEQNEQTQKDNAEQVFRHLLMSHQMATETIAFCQFEICIRARVGSNYPSHLIHLSLQLTNADFSTLIAHVNRMVDSKELNDNNIERLFSILYQRIIQSPLSKISIRKFYDALTFAFAQRAFLKSPLMWIIFSKVHNMLGNRRGAIWIAEKALSLLDIELVVGGGGNLEQSCSMKFVHKWHKHTNKLI